MIRSNRFRSAVLLGAAALAMAAPAAAANANLVWLAGAAMGNESVKEAGEYGMAVAAVGAGIGTAVGLTGVGAAAGGALVAASGITGGIYG